MRTNIQKNKKNMNAKCFQDNFVVIRNSLWTQGLFVSFLVKT